MKSTAISAIQGLYLVVFLSLTGCTLNPATGEQSFTGFMSLEDEMVVGAEEHPKILKEFGGEYKDRALATYVRQVGQSLVEVSELPKLPFTFSVLNDEKVNAFALPGGYVYVTRGLLALADNEAEMAGILAHEIGHITARHTAQRYSQATATNLGLSALGILGNIFGAPPGLGQVISLGAQAVLRGYSREQEMEADMLGVRYVARAGYSSDALSSFFYKMKAHSELAAAQEGDRARGDKFNIMATHPRTADRIIQAMHLAKAAPVKNPKIGRDTMLARIDGLLFGDSLEQGIRKGRVYAHPELRIRFMVPEGFTMLNSDKQLVALGPNGARLAFDMVDAKTAGRVNRLSDYITNNWGENLPIEEVERIEINGLAAATGRSRISGKSGPRDVRLVVIRPEPGLIYRLLFLTPPGLTASLNEELRRTTYSFEHLSENEAAAIKPLRVRIKRVSSGDTVASFSARMPFERFSQEWFKTLNGLRQGETLRPGAWVKVIAE
jgi:predicted Zn-dependent protease